jgi:hypothetical protein
VAVASSTEALDSALREREFPGKRTRLEQLERSAPQPRARWSSTGPGRRSLVDDLPAPRLGFEDYRVLGLRELLQRIDPDPALRRAVLAAADRTLARRAALWDHVPRSVVPASDGRATWHAAERHAVTLYRHAADVGEVDEHDPAIVVALEQRGTGPLKPRAVRAKRGRIVTEQFVRVDDVVTEPLNYTQQS